MEFMSSVLTGFDQCSNTDEIRAAYLESLNCMSKASCSEFSANDPEQTHCYGDYEAYAQLRDNGGAACAEIDD
jgi:hypothetical protein